MVKTMGYGITKTVKRLMLYAGMICVAALLVGGATASKAGVKNAMIGLLLFHAMFVVSPGVGRQISGNELVAEATRNFMTYGVIGLSLGLHVWKTRKAAERELSLGAVDLPPPDNGNRTPPPDGDPPKNDPLGDLASRMIKEQNGTG